MNSLIQYQWLNRWLMPFCLLVCLVTFVLQVEAQEMPPRPIIVVRMNQQLNFGSIVSGQNGGRVKVDFNGGRQFISGDIILLSSTTSCAGFTVDAEPGTMINIVNGQDAILTGPKGTVTLHLEDASTGNPFITTGTSTDVYIGGTLIIGTEAASPPGFYSGSFSVTFIQQ